MNKLLVPVDFSDTSLNALFYAIRLFGRSNVEITVLHTYDVSSSAFRMKSMDSILERDSESEMNTFLEKVEEKEPGAVLKPKILKSNAVSAITSLGDSGKYDYVVMGTKGATGLKEVFIGSVAGGVIAKTKAPVLVVPDGYEYQPMDEIVFAVSGLPLPDVAVVEPLRKLAKMQSSKINVLHIAKGKELELEEALKSIEDLDPTVTYAFGTGNVNQRLNEYLQNEKAGLLCLTRSKKDFFSRLFNESVTMKQTFHSPVPLLILHE
jgi:nucleotide-binding universal stress UspA family protein